MADSPLVSVIMSVFNGQEFLEEAINSVILQDYPNIEFIVVDDGSSDNSLPILRRAAQSDSRIVVLTQDNIGLTKSLIRAVNSANGSLIARMDADDVSYPGRIRSQVRALNDEPTAALASVGYHRIDQVGNVFGRSDTPSDSELIRFLMMFINSIGGHGHVMFRKTAYEAAGGYDPQVRFSQDYDLWTRMIEIGPFIQVAEPLYGFRSGHDSISSKNSGAQLNLACSIAAEFLNRETGIEVSIDEMKKLRAFFGRPRGVELTASDIPLIENLLIEIMKKYTDRKSTSIARNIAFLIGSRKIAMAHVIKNLPVGEKARLILAALVSAPSTAMRLPEAMRPLLRSLRSSQSD